MTKKRDPDIMAMDHAIRWMKRSTPRMLKANVEFVIAVLQKLVAQQVTR